jgi:non-canonical poly(A) RNA polymerase PAPD5/7
LLKTDHNTGSEVAFFNTSGGITYRALDELSDSDEAAMDISGDEAEAAEEPSHKRARVAVEQSASDNNAPKWSNPDPYTALPPETASQAKKKDVVQMIRKARVQAKEVRTSLPSESADFISFDLDESDESDDSDRLDQGRHPAPTATPSDGSARLDLNLPSKPAALKPAKAPVLLPDRASSALGSRKRTHDDEIKMPHARFKKVTKAPAGGGLSTEWVPDPDLVSTPWMCLDHSGSANMAVW